MCDLGLYAEVGEHLLQIRQRDQRQFVISQFRLSLIRYTLEAAFLLNAPRYLSRYVTTRHRVVDNP